MMSLFLSKHARHLQLLLILVAAVGGLLFLFDVFVGLVSSGQTDLFTAGGPDERQVGLPSGGTLAEALAFGLAFALAAGAAYLPHRWRVRNGLPLSHWSTPASAVLALALLGLGAYLLASEIVVQQLPYQDHRVERSAVQPTWLVVLFALFLGTLVVTVARPRGIAVLISLWLLIMWVAAFVVFSLFDDSSLAGLRLFQKVGPVQLSPAYAKAVAPHRTNVGGQESVSLFVSDYLERLMTGGAVEREAASNALKDVGASVFGLESGGAVVNSGGLSWWIPGTTADRSEVSRRHPVFEVNGAAETSYLRTATGDTYENGQWTQAGPAWLPYDSPSADVLDIVRARIASPTEEMELVPDWRANPSLIAGGEPETAVLTVSPRASRHIPAGVLPTTRDTASVSVAGRIDPLSATFAASEPVLEYSWAYQVREFSEGLLSEAEVVTSPTYTQIPDDLPSRIRLLALEITEGHTTPYGKAKAIEEHLSSRYVYAFSESAAGSKAPDGRDPVDWFLFDSEVGTSGSFSSAFAVLARSVGIPARVVSGWAIARVDGTQTVYTDQAHQWAEVALAGIGWVTFDPTPPGGSLSRVGEYHEPAGNIPVERRLSASIEMLANEYPLRRETAARALAELGYADAIGPLANVAIADEDPLVRQAAVEALVELGADHPEEFSVRLAKAIADGGPGVPPSLVDLFLGSVESESPQVRRDSATVLGLLRDERSIGHLVHLTLFDVDEVVRQTGESALANVAAIHADGYQRLAEVALFDGGLSTRIVAAEILMRALLHDDPSVQVAAMEPLVELGFVEAVPPLLHLVLYDESETVRKAAAAALGGLAPSDAAGRLSQVAEHEDVELRIAAVEGLGEMGDLAAIDPLFKSALTDEDFRVRQAAARGLGKTSHPRALNLVWAAFNNEDPDHRVAAAEILGGMGNRWAIGPLAEAALYDVERRVRIAAAKALGKLEPIEALQRMLGPLERGNSQVRVAAAEAMAYLRNGNALVPLAEAALLDDVKAVRTAAAMSMGVLDSERAVQLVLPFLEDARGNVRLAAVEALANIGNESAAEHLPDLVLFDELVGVRRAAARAIGSLRPDWLPEPILQALENEDAELRRAAVDAFRLLGNIAALEILLDVALYDEYNDIRELAVYAMSTLEPELTTSLLLESLRSQSPDEREAAAKALGFLVDLTVLEDLTHVLIHDEFDRVRRQAADTLLTLSTLTVLDLVLDAARAGDDRTRHKTARALEELLNATLFHDAAFRIDIWRRFGNDSAVLDYVDTRRTIEILLEGLTGPDQTARENAAKAFGELGDSTAFEPLLSAFANSSDDVRNAVRDALDHIGAAHILLENGGISASLSDSAKGMVPIATARRASHPTKFPVMQVSGSTDTRYLRTATGDVYENGSWTQLDHISVPTGQAQHIPEAVRSLLLSSSEGLDGLPPERLNTALLAGYEIRPEHEATDHIIVSFVEARHLVTGVVANSLHTSKVYRPGMFRPFSATLVLDNLAIGYEFASYAPTFSNAQLRAANTASDSTYLQLPENLPERLKELALRITERYTSPYDKAKAIESYLEQDYTYSFLPWDNWRVGAARPDPVDWFLFESREGTCGNFSSAFVVLARLAGLPARVVSGWAVAKTPLTQTVYSDQAHQWAEVAFEGLGWVTFDPTPYGDGAPNRADDLEGVDRSEDPELEERRASATLYSGDTAERASAARALGDSGNDQHVESLASALADSEVSVVEAARDALERLGASVQTLENGGSLVITKNLGYWVSGVTTAQSAGLAKNPIFEVTGAAFTDSLRLTVGDVYRNGRWLSLFPVELPSPANARVPQIVTSALSQPDGPFSSIPDDRLDLSLVRQYETTPANAFTDRIRIKPIGGLRAIPGGPVPVSENLQSINIQGRFFPFSATFASDDSIAQYSWTSRVPQYSRSQLADASATSDPTYTQLPADLPARIRELALTVTRGHVGTYEKAKALETFLSTTYPYRFADSQDDFPPAGRDPVDWFLFDHREGTCGVYSSAFVVMARSVGIPARVVSGWAIGRDPGTQTVYSNQGHQWAEVALEGLGWVKFEPTGGGGARSRVISADGPLAHLRSTPIVRNTETEITSSPNQVRRDVPFTVSGTVLTLSGLPVSEMAVEIFINETKEHGGTVIGDGTATKGRFAIEVLVPSDLDLGNYQLLAHAIATEDYRESWSDPDISVYSGAQFELTGPTKLPVDTPATFIGKLFEENGVAIGNHDVSVSVDGRNLAPSTTDTAGAFEFSTSFDEPGAHTVEVEFEEGQFLLGNVVRLPIEVTLPTRLSVYSHTYVGVDEEFLVSGTLLDARGTPLADREVSVSLGESDAVMVRTDSRGDFRADMRGSTPGDYLVVARFEGGRPGADFLESSGDSVIVSVGVPSLTVETPDRVNRGDTLTLRGTIAVSGRGLPGAELTIEGGQIVRSNRSGAYVIRHRIPEDAPLGAMALEVLAPRFGVSAEVTALVTSRTSMVVDAAIPIFVGEEFTVSGNLRDDLGEPIAGMTVELRVGEARRQLVETDVLGDFEYTHIVDLADAYAIRARFVGAGDYLSSDGHTAIQARYATDLLLRGPVEVNVGDSGLISGLLVARPGSPVEAATIRITDSNGELLAELTPDESGEFQFQHTFEETGLTALTASLLAADTWIPSSASLAFKVVNPVSIQTQGSKIALIGERYAITGSLSDSEGIPITNEAVEIEVDGSAETTVTTDSGGGFSWETAFDEEGVYTLVADFAGSDHLGADSATLRVTAGRPIVVVNTPGPVARGDTLTLRGQVSVGSELLSNIGITLGGGQSGTSNRNGVFVIRHEVPEDARLGSADLEVSTPELGVSTAVPVSVYSATTIVAAPLEVVRPGQPFTLRATLLDDQGIGVPDSRLRIGENVVVTDAAGTATTSLLVDPAEQRAFLTLLIAFDGGDEYSESAYSLQLPVTFEVFNWPLWVGLPLLVFAVSLAGFFAGRRGLVLSTSTPPPGPGAALAIAEAAVPVLAPDDEYAPGPAATRLEMTFLKPESDLPDVWEVGEEVQARLELSDRSGDRIGGALLAVVLPGSHLPIELVTDDAGQSAVSFIADDAGSYALTASFQGVAERYVSSSASAEYRVVDFREEIVRLYNLFVEWAGRQAAGVTERSTPREVELMIATSSVSVDERALEQIIARFEEADYSEHVITRRQYAAMFRAWSAVVKAGPGA